ncbi:hypothetical protein B0H12DRAFT_1155078 [Mycena haematopus]|nr:hypothetical protein B0H12DRAFT_1155078 [Mycena haematopus]
MDKRNEEGENQDQTTANYYFDSFLPLSLPSLSLFLSFEVSVFFLPSFLLSSSFKVKVRLDSKPSSSSSVSGTGARSIPTLFVSLRLISSRQKSTPQTSAF